MRDTGSTITSGVVVPNFLLRKFALAMDFYVLDSLTSTAFVFIIDVAVTFSVCIVRSSRTRRLDEARISLDIYGKQAEVDIGRGCDYVS